jgi:hypothetical protein
MLKIPTGMGKYSSKQFLAKITLHPSRVQIFPRPFCFQTFEIHLLSLLKVQNLTADDFGFIPCSYASFIKEHAIA